MLALALSFAAFPTGAQQPPPNDQTLQSLRRDMNELIKGQIELQKELRELKTMVQDQRPVGAPAAAPTPRVNFDFDVAGAPGQGVPQAPLIIVEFSDFQCPFCARYDKDTYHAIEQNYVRTGKLRYIFEDFPLPIHPLARHLAATAECLSIGKDFWTVREALFSNQATLTSDQAIDDFAKRTSMEINDYQACQGDKATAARIDQAVTAASSAGVTGTPTFFIGRNEPGTTKFKVLKVIVGAQPFDNFKQTFDALLNAPAT
jgi:protein-disulfide isomerase